MTMRPCVECGEPSEQSRCPEHQPLGPKGGIKTSAQSRGYDAAWARLSRKARMAQPFCSDCGATEDLQCDHTPEAWARHLAGKAVRLADVDVVCGRCNRARGAARPSVIATEMVGGVPGVGGTTTRVGEAKFRLHTPKFAEINSKREKTRR